MKNKLLSLVSIVALVLFSAGPIAASADSHKFGLGLGISDKVNVSGQDKNGDSEINEHSNANLNSDEGEDHIQITSSSSLSASTSVSQNDGRLPPGIRHSKGIEKRIDDGKGLPSGLLKFLQSIFGRFGFSHKDNGTTTEGTTTPGVILPKLSDLQVVTATSSATISFKTNEDTSSELRYGTSSDITASSSSVVNATLSLDHSVSLSNLLPDTTYHFVIVATDSSGNVKTTDTLSFKTKALGVVDVTPPTIYFNTVYGVTANGANIFWATNESSNTKVWVSTTTPVDTSVAANVSVSNLVHFHNAHVGGLATSTTYFYTVGSADASGNMATSSGTFTTL